MPKDQRGRRSKEWCFTSFNELEPAYNGVLMQYLCYGKEVCPTSGRPHWQGYVVFVNRARLAEAKTHCGRSWHLEAARGSLAENVGYCSKDGVFTEHGTRPAEKGKPGGVATRNKWMAIRQQAESGDFNAIPSKVYVQHARGLHFIHDYAATRRPVLDVLPGSVVGVWIHGEPGVGKSHFLRAAVAARGASLYAKAASKWWDGYSGEAYVIIDDIDIGHANLGHALKIWLDLYPFVAEHKGGAQKIRPLHVYITSNYSIYDVFGKDVPLYRALERRCLVVNAVSRDYLNTVELPLNNYVELVKTETIVISDDEIVPAVCADVIVPIQ